MTTPTLEQAARELLALVENVHFGAVTPKDWDKARMNLRAALAATSTERVSVPIPCRCHTERDKQLCADKDVCSVVVAHGDADGR